MIELKPCPFCGGNGKPTFKDYKFGGKTYRGDKSQKYRVQIICNRCRSRGKPVITDWMVNPNPYISAWGNVYNPNSDRCKAQTEMFEPFVCKAADAWNGRVNDATD